MDILVYDHQFRPSSISIVYMLCSLIGTNGPWEIVNHYLWNLVETTITTICDLILPCCWCVVSHLEAMSVGSKPSQQHSRNDYVVWNAGHVRAVWVEWEPWLCRLWNNMDTNMCQQVPAILHTMAFGHIFIILYNPFYHVTSMLHPFYIHVISMFCQEMLHPLQDVFLCESRVGPPWDGPETPQLFSQMHPAQFRTIWNMACLWGFGMIWGYVHNCTHA